MTEPTELPERTICATCHRPLALYQRPREVHGTWLHHQWDEADHQPVPKIEQADDAVAELCDFCGRSEVEWSYPCETFVVEFAPFPDLQGMVGSWAACRRCSSLIEQGLMDELAHRAVKRMPRPVRSSVLPAVRKLHRLFAKNRCGARRLIRAV